MEKGDGQRMDEKGRLAAMAAVFIGLSVFCWGTAIWSGQADFVAAGTLPETQAVSAVREEPVSLAESVQSEAESSSSEPAQSGTAQEDEVYTPLTDEEARLLAGCLASAGTPFFEHISSLSVPQLETAALWWGMERGEMPECKNGVVTLTAETVLGWIWKLFGVEGIFPEDCGLADYDPEQDAFVLAAAAVFPAHYPVVSGTAQTDSGETQVRVSLLSVDGWEGDVMGNIYLPETVSEGVLVLRNGKVSAWQAG